MSTKVSELGLRAIVVLIAVSVPVFLGLETLLRIYVLGPLYGPVIAELAAMRGYELAALGPRATSWAWALIGVTGIAGLVGVAVLRRTARRALEAEAPATKIRDQLLVLTSIPQVPGLLSTFCFALGAELTPVLICVAVSTAFVIAQGFVGEHMLAERDTLARARVGGRDRDE